MAEVKLDAWLDSLSVGGNDSPDAMTSAELTEVYNRNRFGNDKRGQQWVCDHVIKIAVDQGKLVSVRVQRKRMDGVMTKVPAYQLVKAAPMGAEKKGKR